MFCGFYHGKSLFLPPPKSKNIIVRHKSGGIKRAHFLGDFLFKTFLLQNKQKIHNVGRQQCFGGWVSDGFSFYQLGVVQRCTWGVHDPTWRVFLQTLLQDVSLFHETSMVFVEVFSMKRLLLTLPTIMLGKSGSSDSFP